MKNSMKTISTYGLFIGVGALFSSNATAHSGGHNHVVTDGVLATLGHFITSEFHVVLILALGFSIAFGLCAVRKVSRLRGAPRYLPLRAKRSRTNQSTAKTVRTHQGG